MYGSIFRMKVKPGREADVVGLVKEWNTTRLTQGRGALAVFQDKASYSANADDPEQDGWYRRLRENLESDPEWEDGEYVAGALGPVGV